MWFKTLAMCNWPSNFNLLQMTFFAMNKEYRETPMKFVRRICGKKVHPSQENVQLDTIRCSSLQTASVGRRHTASSKRGRNS